MKRLIKWKTSMLKKILLLLGMVLILLSGNPINGSAGTDPTSSENADLSTLQFKRIAVMPFLVGKLESPEEPIEKPLSQPLKQLNIDTDKFGRWSGSDHDPASQ